MNPCMECGEPVTINAVDAPAGAGDVFGGFIHFGCVDDYRRKHLEDRVMKPRDSGGEAA